MTTKVEIHVKKLCLDNEVVNTFYSIRSIEDQVAYKFPKEYRNEKFHKEILTLSACKAAIKGMLNIGNFRNIKLTLTPNIRPLYMDEDGNFIFKDYLLEEIGDETPYASENNFITHIYI